MTKMRLLAAALTACAVASASASLEAAVYVLDSDLAPSYRGPSITTQNAQLWLAYRLGLSSFYSVSEADDETFSLLNRFGDEAQATLFTPSEPNPRKLVVVEGVENPQGSYSVNTPAARSYLIKLSSGTRNLFQLFIFPSSLHLSKPRTSSPVF